MASEMFKEHLAIISDIVGDEKATLRKIATKSLHFLREGALFSQYGLGLLQDCISIHAIPAMDSCIADLQCEDEIRVEENDLDRIRMKYNVQKHRNNINSESMSLLSSTTFSTEEEGRSSHTAVSREMTSDCSEVYAEQDDDQPMLLNQFRPSDL